MTKLEKVIELAKQEVKSGEFRPFSMVKECVELTNTEVGNKETTEIIKAFNNELYIGREALMASFEF